MTSDLFTVVSPACRNVSVMPGQTNRLPEIDRLPEIEFHGGSEQYGYNEIFALYD